MANQSVSVWKKDPKVEGCNAEAMTHVLETASASLLMYFRVRKSTKLEFGFSSWSHFGECENAHGVSLPIGRTVSKASSNFRRSYLSFQQGALCTTPQRLMKSLELVSLGEEVESNRNTSCALLITTLITSVKMSIAAALCCAGATEPYMRTLPEPGRCAFVGLPYHLLPPVRCERTHTYIHTRATLLGNKVTAPTCLFCDIFLFRSDFLIHFRRSQ